MKAKGEEKHQMWDNDVGLGLGTVLVSCLIYSMQNEGKINIMFREGGGGEKDVRVDDMVRGGEGVEFRGGGVEPVGVGG